MRKIRKIRIDQDGPVGPLPAGVTWDPARRAVGLTDTTQTDGLLVWGTGRADAVITGQGSVHRIGAGSGAAYLNGYSVGTGRPYAAEADS